LGANATGTHKLKPLVIGSSAKPRCLNHINLSRLPVTYKANSKAWMRSEIFSEWLRGLDNQFRRENRKILLLVDNAPSHFCPLSNDPNESDESNDSSNEDYNVPAAKSLEHISLQVRTIRTRGINTESLRLTNIDLVFLPPNTTSHLQPMDAGIIQSFKARYKQYYVRHILNQFERNEDIKK
jgi:DDE superfamily endonuclease